MERPPTSSVPPRSPVAGSTTRCSRTSWGRRSARWPRRCARPWSAASSSRAEDVTASSPTRSATRWSVRSSATSSGPASGASSTPRSRGSWMRSSARRAHPPRSLLRTGMAPGTRVVRCRRSSRRLGPPSGCSRSRRCGARRDGRWSCGCRSPIRSGWCRSTGWGCSTASRMRRDCSATWIRAPRRAGRARRGRGGRGPASRRAAPRASSLDPLGARRSRRGPRGGRGRDGASSRCTRPRRARARALAHLAGLRMFAGDLDGSRIAAEEAIDLARRVGGHAEEAIGLGCSAGTWR